MSARVSQVDGTFSLPGVALYPGTNTLVVRLRDVSGNEAEQVRTVVRTNTLETFQYDGNGNLTNWVKAGENWVYEWDWADRLLKVTSNGVVVLENWYDASSRRIAKKKVIDGQTRYMLYLWDGLDSVAVLNQSAQVQETFTRAAGLAGDIGTLAAVTHHAGSWTNGIFYAHHNHWGDIVLTRSGTATVGSYSYSAFGLQHSAFGPDVCRYTFSSKERDPSIGMFYNIYRFYAAFLQRWLNSDPVREDGGWNVFNYVHNNPIVSVDLLGLWKDPQCVRSCEEAFGEDDTALGYWRGAAIGFLISLLQSVGDEGIATDGGRLMKICKAGKLTRFGRWLRATSVYALLGEALNQAPRFYGLETCIANYPEARKCPKNRSATCRYDTSGGRNDPPHIILW